MIVFRLPVIIKGHKIPAVISDSNECYIDLELAEILSLNRSRDLQVHINGIDIELNVRFVHKFTNLLEFGIPFFKKTCSSLTIHTPSEQLIPYRKKQLPPYFHIFYDSDTLQCLLHFYEQTVPLVPLFESDQFGHCDISKLETDCDNCTVFKTCLYDCAICLKIMCSDKCLQQHVCYNSHFN